MARPVNPRFRASKYLCLPPATGDLPSTGGVIVASAAPPLRKPIEHAGHAYQQRLRNTHCTAAAKAENAASAAASAAQATGAAGGGSKQAVGNDEHALKRKLATDGDDLYELLELGDKRWHATADEIKKSFRRISLLYHPDKLRHKVSHLGEDAIAETENHFKKVMKAYDILSDKKKRASYDSIDDVDDSIPSEKELNDKNFYKKMGDCFALNARWSVSDRVPGLGDENTPVEEVNKFYDFWYSFKTWRDFSFDLEYNTDQAECREEKRWMDRQNAKHIKARKLEENARLRRLVDLGYKKDPRIRREKESAKAKKEAVKEARRKQREEAEEQKRAEEEKSRLEQERKALDDKEKRAKAKKEKDAARKLIRKARQKLRAVARDCDLVSNIAAITAIEKMCSEGNVSTIDAFADRLALMHANDVPGPRISNVAKLVDDVLTNGIASLSSASAVKATAATSSDSTQGRGTDVEPQKTSETISESTAAHSSVPETSEVKYVSTDSTTAKTERVPNGVKSSGGASHDSATLAKDAGSSNSAWTPQEMSLLSKGLAKFPGGTRNRWERLAHYVGTRSEQEVLAKVNAMRPSKLHNGKGSAAKRAPLAKESTAEASKPKPANGTVSEPSKKSPTKQATAVEPAQPGKPPNRFVFTAKQQQQLEAAMKKFPGKLGASRWVKIAGEVSGRSATECEERCKELISYYRAKKSSAT